MKFFRFFAIVSILGIACIFTVGCDKMDKPVMDAMDMAMVDDTQQPVDPPEIDDTQQPVDPPEIDDTQQPVDPPEIDDTQQPVDPPEMDNTDGDKKPTLPEDFEILPDDNVVHVTELNNIYVYLNDTGEADINGFRDFYFPLILDESDGALNNTTAIRFFQWWDLQIAENCKNGTVMDTGGLTLYFTHPNRGERDEFVQPLMDGLQPEDFPPGVSSLTSDWQVSTSVVILNNEVVYYAVSLALDLDELDALCEQ